MAMPLISAESTILREVGLHIARLGLIVNLLLNGFAKFEEWEAEGIKPLVSQSPLFTIPLKLIGLRGVSNSIGVAELITVVLLIVGIWSWYANSLAVVISLFTFLTTLSFLITSIDYNDFSWHVQVSFLLKDVVLLGAGIALYRPRKVTIAPVTVSS